MAALASNLARAALGSNLSRLARMAALASNLARAPLGSNLVRFDPAEWLTADGPRSMGSAESLFRSAGTEKEVLSELPSLAITLFCLTSTTGTWVSFKLKRLEV
jgi:hypothetical protein